MRRNEQGVIITLVAVFMLFVVGAMAALSIDVVAIYTARSEAQLAADSAALAAARVLANSGATSDTTSGSMPAAWALAQAVALSVAEQNTVGGANLTAPEVTFPGTPPGGTNTNPTVTVRVQVNNLPTFFARIWGSTQASVAATATAEAYNPSEAPGTSTNPAPPVAPLCVKPWLLPNIDPTQGSAAGPAIFDSTSGHINNSDLLGKPWPSGLSSACSDCSGVLPGPSPGQYYPGAIDAADFPEPTVVPACSASFTNPYQFAVAGCVPQPIACGPTPSINIDTSPYGATRDADTVLAASCLIHDTGANGDADSLENSTAPSPPFQFIGGNQNPIVSARTKDIPVSDSLVTVPVIDTGAGPPPTQVTVVGFLQVFLSPTGNSLTGSTQIPVTIINMVGCGSKVGGQPIIGNGASPVAVRLISP